MEDVAKLHKTTVVPSKDELLQQWLPRQPWFDARGDNLTRVASYRFLDPAGEVGIETLLMSDGQTIWHVPLTYRSDRIDGQLVGTMEHGVLGRRFVHYGPSDPVYVEQVTDIIVQAGRQARLPEGVEVAATAEGSGLAGSIAELHLEVARRTDQPVDGLGVLRVSWKPQFQQRLPLVALRAERT